MAHKQNLPWELIEEILSRVPPKSLVRFRIVSKQWNALFDDKKFINNHKKTFRFILTTKSKIYSVSIDPKIEVRELTLDIPGLESRIPKYLVDGNGFLLCGMDKRSVVWNPWLRQTRWIEPEVNQPSLQFFGIGYEYDNDRSLKESGYKALAYCKMLESNKIRWKIHDLDSHAWKDVGGRSSSEGTNHGTFELVTRSGVSLNGTLYLVAYHGKTDPLFILLYFRFTSEGTLKLCDLPCGRNHRRDAFVLRVFMEDRFSLLKQCHLTKKIEIWVTKDKISNNCGGNVEWINLMEVSSTNLPDLVPTGSHSQPSYFVDDKRLVVCSCDETGRAWIYVMGENKLISKIKIDYVVDPWPLHCTYIPSLVPVLQGQREEAELQV